MKARKDFKIRACTRVRKCFKIRAWTCAYDSSQRTGSCCRCTSLAPPRRRRPASPSSQLTSATPRANPSSPRGRSASPRSPECWKVRDSCFYLDILDRKSTIHPLKTSFRPDQLFSAAGVVQINTALGWISDWFIFRVTKETVSLFFHSICQLVLDSSFVSFVLYEFVLLLLRPPPPVSQSHRVPTGHPPSVTVD